MAAAEALQSILLRLCVLCSTSLQTIQTSPTETIDRETSRQDGRALSEKLYQDLLILNQQVRKEATALSLAMRPSSREMHDDADPLDGLDEKSIEAASHLLQSLATDAVPKLVFLANLAQKNQRVYDTTDAVANDTSLQEAREMGAHIVLGENAMGKHVVSASVGSLFANDVRRYTADVIETIGLLCQSFMNVRTRTVLARAQEKRGEQSESPTPPSRQASLALTKKLWTLCDAAEGDKTHTPAYIARLPRNNYEALYKLARQHELVMRDGVTELEESLENDSLDSPQPPSDDVEDMWERHVQLSEEEKKAVRNVLDLVRSGIALLKQAMSAAAAAKDVDLDRVAELMEELASTQDDLIASVLYEEETAEGLGEVAQAYVDACEALHECVDTSSGMDAIEAAWHSLSL